MTHRHILHTHTHMNMHKHIHTHTHIYTHTYIHTQQAGNMYKLANAWEAAGDAYKLSSDYYNKSDSAHDAVTNMVEAAKAYVCVYIYMYVSI